MSLKTKITLAFLTMLLLLVGVSAYTLYSLNRLDRSSRNVLQDNFYSVNLGQQMLRALDRMAAAPPAGLPQFRAALTREAGNITEPGEREVVDSLTATLAAYERNPGPALAGRLRGQTYRMIEVNTQALTRKNEAANRAATQQSRYVLAMLTFALLVSLMFVLSVPEAAVSGLRKLSASIDNAARQDFSASVPTESHDEFGAVARSFNRLLVQLQDYRASTLAQLLAERNRAASIVNNLDEGLVLIDEHRRVLLANPVAAQLLALPVERLVGRPADELAQENDLLRELLRHLDVPAARRAQEAAPLLTLAQNGEEVYYRLAINDVVSFNQALDKMEFVGSILTLRNVSDFKRLDQAKSNFLATVSHELKTPLSSININLRLLQDERLPAEERQRVAASIRQEVQRLQRMVGELLDVARLDAGAGIQLDLRPTDLAEVVRFATATVRAQLDDKRIRLALELPATLPAVRADVEKTTWVLINLLANAIRYSPPEEFLTVRADATGGVVQVSVQDRGPGIAAEHHDRIFQRFAQVPGPAGYRGGSGLGLSIAREFITTQGGRLWVESELGAGSTFHFTLPAAS
ncbi:HAMP domain-containing sensor histidine kinase [Hymenobacter weizhouensis]|uniref:HAMP domain-containing sensor histidine kinase n=1 Tax=Hymenobacter sp. YIM 151500-1 TaxID=2987689 RepID=UPI002227680F|nr:ATP-binding protein [Hymenobacter sp. YIM 151500-1]UYZ64730.1 ATP-binding protein [Hymenobacter sp. YIM 151500-1]